VSRTRLNGAAGDQIRSPSTSALAAMRNRRRAALRPRRTRKMTLGTAGGARNMVPFFQSERSVSAGEGRARGSAQAGRRRPDSAAMSHIKSGPRDAEEGAHIAKLLDRPLADVKAALKRAARGSRPDERPPDCEQVHGGDQAARSFIVAGTQARREDRAGRPHGRRPAGPPLPAAD